MEEQWIIRARGLVAQQNSETAMRWRSLQRDGFAANLARAIEFQARLVLSWMWSAIAQRLPDGALLLVQRLGDTRRSPGKSERMRRSLQALHVSLQSVVDAVPQERLYERVILALHPRRHLFIVIINWRRGDLGVYAWEESAAAPL